MYVKLSVALSLFVFFSFDPVQSDSFSNELPSWTFAPVALRRCPLDSPEIYVDQVYQRKLNALLNEGRVLFASLLEALERSLDEELKESLEEGWIQTSENLVNEQVSTGARIQSLWELVIARWEAGALPWEQRLKQPLLVELLSAIGTEHLHLRSSFQHGIQAILKPIQPYVADVLKRIDARVKEAGTTSTRNVADKLEEITTEVEPTFVGKLLVALVRRNATGLSFVSEVLEEIAIVIEAFRERSSYHSLFWTEMTLLLTKQLPTEQEMFKKYMGSEDEILKTMIQILQETAGHK